MIDETKFKQLKKKAAEARAERDRASGKLESAMTRLEEEFGCTTIEEAEAKSVQLDKEAAEAEAAYDTAVVEFEEAWEDELGA